MADLVSIVIPHYRTRDLITLCLRSIRSHTCCPIQVIVVDNDSRDDSLEYLRSVRWIQLIERGAAVGANGSAAHRQALDVGLSAAEGSYFLSIHTDTIVKHPGWLDYLLGELRATEKTAAVGTWKLEAVPPAKRIGKVISEGIRDFYRSVIGRRLDRPAHYIRTHCALYRIEPLLRHGLRFDSREGGGAGEAIHRGLLENGYDVRWLREEVLMNYVDHLNHGTAFRTVPAMASTLKGRRHFQRVARYNRQPWVRALLEDSALDR